MLPPPRRSSHQLRCLRFIQCILLFINRTLANLRLACEEGKRSLVCFALQNAAFGVLLRTLWPFSLLALVCAEGRVAPLLSQTFADVMACGGVWRPAECCAAQCAMLGFAEHLWPLCTAVKRACTMSKA